MNRPLLHLAAVVVAQAAACATAREPVPLPARCLEKPVDAKAPSDAVASEGDREATLNAKRWPFATFFSGMKKKVAEHWKPAEEYQRHAPDPSVYGGKILVTELEVTVRADGSLERVSVRRSSGLGFLDDTAVQALESAQPLGEPPCQILKHTGMMHFPLKFAFDTGHSAASIGEPASPR